MMQLTPYELSIDVGQQVSIDVHLTPSVDVSLSASVDTNVHAQQYQQQQGNSTATLTRSCDFGTFDPQGSALLID
ncbi:hypothetical protein DY000_02015516 [Brassica cretica]|uniref:Uncharacterized protein n=1 Tax=Brassica cretica TaxID=69181 RepID=A0ABQ7DCX9_BRACR|nr:hypothetical protein DY000_02015516 [Brassica cretica]